MFEYPTTTTLRFLVSCSFLFAFSSARIEAQSCIDANGGSFSVDYPVVEITPELRINGVPFSTPAASSVQIWLSRNDVLQRRIAESHVVPVPVRMAAGTYDLVYRNITKTDPDLPQNTEAIIQRNVVINSSGALIVDIPRVHIGGTLTIDGLAFSKSELEDGEAWAVSVDNGSEVYLGDTNDGPAGSTTFAGTLMAGPYDILYRHESGETLVPVNTNALFASLDFQKDNLALAFNLITHQVTGDFYFNSAATPASVLEHGDVELRRITPSGLIDVVYLGDTVDQSYSTRGAFGSYDGYFIWNAGGVAGSAGPRNVEALAVQNVRIRGNPIDIDVAVTPVQATFKFNGGLAPPSNLENGEIRFRDQHNGLETPFAQTMAQTASIRLVPGTYDVTYRHLAGSVAVPRNTFVTALENLVIPDTGGFAHMVDLDIPVTDTAIKMTLNGQALLPADGSGNVLLLNADQSIGLNLQSSAAMPWQYLLVSGTYGLEYSYVGGPSTPRNANTRLPQMHSVTGSSDTMQFELATMAMQPLVTFNGSAFPVSSSVLMILLGTTGSVSFGADNGDWPAIPILQGRYDVLYTYSSGAVIPQNQLYAEYCIHAEFCLFCDGFETP